MTMRTLGLYLLLLTLGLGACERTKAASPRAAAQPPASAVKSPPVSKLARIVFIDKEKACDCTRKRVEQAWTTLQSALGAPAVLPVQRLHVDTQAAEAAVYTNTKPLMVLPGIYFVDGQGGVVEMLQGEVEAKDIAAVLGRR
jgi:hypothetical protein